MPWALPDWPVTPESCGNSNVGRASPGALRGGGAIASSAVGYPTLGPSKSKVYVTLQSHGSAPRQQEVPSDSGRYVFRSPGGDADGSEEDIALDKIQAASRWHAVLFRDDAGACFIMDLSSASGTFMLGERLPPQAAQIWEPGTVVTLGAAPHHVEITFKVVEALESAPPLGNRSSAAAVVGEAGGVTPHGAKRSHETCRSVEPPRKQQRTSSTASNVPSTTCSSNRSSSASSASRSSTSSATPAPHSASSTGAHGKATNPKVVQGVSSSVDGRCDKCDGKHPTDRCPYFRKARDSHKDAWVNKGNKKLLQMGKGGGKFVLRGGRPVRQPGDGSCLFHSLCYGLNRIAAPSGRRQGASQLRKELANFINRSPRAEISGDTLEEWVRWDAHTSVPNYARRMAQNGHWGGGIEMAVCALLHKVNVHVYEQRRGGTFERISCFDSPERTKRTVHVLYQGGVHYDALLPHI